MRNRSSWGRYGRMSLGSHLRILNAKLDLLLKMNMAKRPALKWNGKSLRDWINHAR